MWHAFRLGLRSFLAYLPGEFSSSLRRFFLIVTCMIKIVTSCLLDIQMNVFAVWSSGHLLVLIVEISLSNLPVCTNLSACTTANLNTLNNRRKHLPKNLPWHRRVALFSTLESPCSRSTTRMYQQLSVLSDHSTRFKELFPDYSGEGGSECFSITLLVGLLTTLRFCRLRVFPRL